MLFNIEKKMVRSSALLWSSARNYLLSGRKWRPSSWTKDIQTLYKYFEHVYDNGYWPVLPTVCCFFVISWFPFKHIANILKYYMYRSPKTVRRTWWIFDRNIKHVGRRLIVLYVFYYYTWLHGLTMSVIGNSYCNIDFLSDVKNQQVNFERD